MVLSFPPEEGRRGEMASDLMSDTCVLCIPVQLTHDARWDPRWQCGRHFCVPCTVLRSMVPQSGELQTKYDKTFDPLPAPQD